MYLYTEGNLCVFINNYYTQCLMFLKMIRHVKEKNIIDRKNQYASIDIVLKRLT